MKLKSFIQLLVFCFFVPAYAALDILSYQGEVPVASYLPADWQKAIAPALEQVLIRVSGNAEITETASVRKALSNPASFVQSYSYVSGSDPKELKLQVRFSPKAIDSLLQVTGRLLASKSPSETPKSGPIKGNALQSTTLIISGVKTLNDYTSVLKYLHHLEGVKEVDNKQTQGNRILVVVNSTKTSELLNEAILKERQLVKTTLKGTVDPSVLVYRWVGTVPTDPQAQSFPASEENEPKP